ncbi:cyclophilin-like fold protein [Microvirga sp. W0021]|uniref:Cyclophilin-like fold protein n=1 Tax=Hohaiivirga grylli TaxID=3133970 RepID=A0ABV0BK25_9HYPH
MKKSFNLGALAISVCIEIVAMGTLSRDVSATSGEASRTKQGEYVRVRMIIGKNELVAALEDNASTRDFISLLPLELKLEDYASKEKIAYLPRKITTAGAPSGMTPVAGDITYFAPWGNLAMFYHGDGYANGLVKLGRIEGDIQILQRAPTGIIRLEKLGQ